MEASGCGGTKPDFKLILVCNNPKTDLIGYLQQKIVTSYKTKVLSDKDALMVLIFLCHRMRVGYEREGMRAIFDCFPDRSISSMMDLLQRVFITKHFISAQFVIDCSGVKQDVPSIPPTRAMEPLDRCAVCTLFPPCKHTTYEKLCVQSAARRKELPRYKDGSMTCPSFKQHG